MYPSVSLSLALLSPPTLSSGGLDPPWFFWFLPATAVPESPFHFPPPAASSIFLLDISVFQNLALPICQTFAVTGAFFFFSGRRFPLLSREEADSLPFFFPFFQKALTCLVGLSLYLPRDFSTLC